MKNMRTITFILLVLCNLQAMSQTEFSIQIDLPHSKQEVWETITDFKAYPIWNSMLYMEKNDSLEVGKHFYVTIINENGKKSRFKAKTLFNKPHNTFAARQVILGKWMFSATHHFIVKEIDDQNTTFIQTWQLTGILSKLFKKQILKQLALFNQMNEDLNIHLNMKELTQLSMVKLKLQL